VSASDPGPVTPPATNAKTLAVVTVFVAFGIGVALGALGLWASVIHRHGGRLPFMAEMREHRILAHLDHELDLTPQQHDAVAAIIREHGRRIDAIVGGLQPQIRREIDQGNVEVERLLTPEQRVKFAKMRMLLHSRRHMPGESSPAGSPDR
jgi:hypothetical protein